MRWICASIVALAAFALVGCSVIVPAETCSVDTDCAWDERCVREGFCVALVGADLPCGTILGSQHPDALKLGFIITLSGADAQGGIDQKKVLEFAVAEINQNGGIHGLQGQRELAFITCDPAGLIGYCTAE